MFRAVVDSLAKTSFHWLIFSVVCRAVHVQVKVARVLHINPVLQYQSNVKVRVPISVQFLADCCLFNQLVREDVRELRIRLLFGDGALWVRQKKPLDIQPESTGLSTGLRLRQG